jgi:molybdate transport system substrate-binding protein
MPVVFRAAVLVMAVVLADAGCGTQTGSSSHSPPSPGSAPAPALTGSLTVLAAASLTDSFNDDKSRLAADNPHLSLSYSFAGSQQLVAQIMAGAPADVVATADEESMARLVAARLVETPRDFARNKLEIAVAPGNPKRINGLSDLARGDLKVVLADPSVPAGKYGRQALDKGNVVAKPVSLELDVRSVLQKVTSGEADAGLVYVTDVKAAGAAALGIEVPDDQNVLATYPVAVVKGTGSHDAAEAFADQLLVGPGRTALLAHGFLAP